MSTKVRLRLLMVDTGQFDARTQAQLSGSNTHGARMALGASLYIGSEAKDTCAWPGTLHAVGRCCRTRYYTDVTIAIADMDAVTMA